MKLKDIKEFLETLTDEQLEQDAVIMGDQDMGFPGGPITISPFDEDHWYSEYGAFSESSISEEEFQEYLEYQGQDARVVFEAGSVFFHFDDSER
ncbi:hypothetical protein [Dyadobacter sp. 3J3]|uniref:hypothetical protein n=1 Tax=Dyadobacter sp. 3J3 TaxID=2606600 RepID=UPI00135C2E41|nr:hypothetical protein [Dyadobacter sp. 3J3]